MKNFDDIESKTPPVGVNPISRKDVDLMAMSMASIREAIPPSIQAITMIASRVAALDACVDLLRDRSPFAALGQVLDKIQKNIQEINKDCLKIYEFCIVENMLECQDKYSDGFDPLSVDIAADPTEHYGK